MITQDNKKNKRIKKVILALTVISVILTGCTNNEIDQDLNNELKKFALEYACSYVNKENFDKDHDVHYVNQYIRESIEGCENYYVCTPIIYQYIDEKLNKFEYDAYYIVYAENNPLVIFSVGRSDDYGFSSHQIEISKEVAEFIDNKPFITLITDDLFFFVTKDDCIVYYLNNPMTTSTVEEMTAQYEEVIEKVKKKVGSKICEKELIDLEYAEKVSENLKYTIIENDIPKETIEQCKQEALNYVLRSEELTMNKSDSVFEAKDPLRQYNLYRMSTNEVTIKAIDKYIDIPIYENGKPYVLCSVDPSEITVRSSSKATDMSQWSIGLQQSNNVAFCGSDIIYEDHYDTVVDEYVWPYVEKSYLEIEKILRQN